MNFGGFRWISVDSGGFRVSVQGRGNIFSLGGAENFSQGPYSGMMDF